MEVLIEVDVVSFIFGFVDVVWDHSSFLFFGDDVLRASNAD